LVITVDCGITAAENKRHAAALGMDMLITDHHEVSGELPTSPVVNPRRPDCPSPAKMLAGVGVAFKLVCAVEGPGSAEAMLRRYADLVAVGTIADVMPMLGENRYLVQRGLEELRRGSRPGFRELCAEAGLELSAISVTNVGFVIAPRINAAGRLGGTETAVELLATRDGARAHTLAQELCSLNAERRRIEDGMLEEALALIGDAAPRAPLVLADARWHQGVAGIVASKIADRMGVPAVMICLKDGVGKGSCRSVGGFNLFEALSAHRELMLSFGGHEMAAGITIAEENIPALRAALREDYAKLPAEEKRAALAVDFEVIKPEGLLTVENVEALDTLEPFGSGNPVPVLSLTGARVLRVTPLSEGKHTKLRVEKNGAQFDVLLFGTGPEALGAHMGARASLAFTPRVNTFRGKKSVQLNLLDYKE
ncbi:MAG: single-stranded-DNA-specific exonuclease RecJ, partial [bacterium]